MSKHTEKYWKARLIRRPGVSALHCRIQFQGKSHYFNLHTEDKDEAATKARDIWLSLHTVGLADTMAKYKPKAAKEEKIPTTVGEWIKAVRPLLLGGELTTYSFTVYETNLRRIASGVAGVKRETRKMDGKFQKWRSKVDLVPLADLQPDRVKAWFTAKLDEVSENPAKLASRKRTLNGYIAQLRAMFHPDLAGQLPNIKLPVPLPHAGLSKYEHGSTKYVSRINPALLLVAAKNELRETKPECYKAFLLALCAGLRRHEVDLLEWDMIDLANHCVRLQPTDLLALKTVSSIGEVDIDPQICEELRSLKAQSKSKFVITSAGNFKVNSRRLQYRAQQVFDDLIFWLRSKGVTSQKPFHELRKEFGAIHTSENGIFAASSQLRHSGIEMTRQAYVDKKKRFTTGLGEWLTAPVQGTGNGDGEGERKSGNSTGN